MKIDREKTEQLFRAVLDVQQKGFFVSFSYQSTSGVDTHHEEVACISIYQNYTDWMYHNAAPLLVLLPAAHEFDKAIKQLCDFAK